MLLRCHFSSWLVAGLPFNAQVMKKGSSGTSDSSKQQDEMDDIKIDESNFDEVRVSSHFYIYICLYVKQEVLHMFLYLVRVRVFQLCL